MEDMIQASARCEYIQVTLERVDVHGKLWVGYCQ